jgi:hypothetical protein
VQRLVTLLKIFRKYPNAQEILEMSISILSIISEDGKVSMCKMRNAGLVTLLVEIQDEYAR